MIKSQLKVILAQREIDSRTPRNIVELAEATGLSRQTLYNLAKNATTRYDTKVLDAICGALNVAVGDLLVYECTESS